MDEPASRIVGGNGFNGQANGLLEGVLGAGAEAAQDRFELGERLLDRREIWRIGRQEEHFALPFSQRLTDARCFMHAQIIQDYYLSRS